MKKHLLIACLMTLSGMLTAQNFIDKHYNNLVDLESSTVVHVAKLTFQIASSVIPEDEEGSAQMKELISSVESFDLVQVPDLENAKDYYQRGLRNLESQFEELMNMKEEGNRFSVHINENGGIVYELVGLGYEETEFTVLSVVGEIALEDLGEVLSKLNKDGLKPLSKIGELGFSELSVYPNPVNAESKITIEIPEEMIGADATLIDLNGGVLKRFQVNDKSHNIGIKGLQPGYFIVSLTKDGVTMKKKVLVVQ